MHKFPPKLQILLSQSGYKPETIDDQKPEKNNNHVHVTVRNSLNRINIFKVKIIDSTFINLSLIAYLFKKMQILKKNRK